MTQPQQTFDVPGTSHVIVQMGDAIEVKTLETISYIGIGKDGHRFLGLYQGDDLTMKAVETHLTNDQMSDISKAFMQNHWQPSDDDIAIIEANARIPAINVQLANATLKFTYQETDYELFNPTITRINRGKTVVDFDIDMTATFRLGDIAYPMTQTVTFVQVSDFKSDDPDFADCLLNEYLSVQKGWVIDVPTTLTVEQWFSNKWYSIDNDLDWYIDDRKVGDFTYGAKDPEGRSYIDAHTFDIEDDPDLSIQPSQPRILYLDETVYSDPQQSIALWYNNPDNKRDLAETRQAKQVVSDAMTELKKARQETYEKMIEALRIAQPEAFTEIDVMDATIEVNQSLLDIANQKIAGLEAGIKEGAVYLWRLGGATDDNKQSDDKVTKVSQKPKIEVVSPKLAAEWAKKNAPDILFETVDPKKTLNRVRAGQTIPDGVRKSETVYASIMSAPLKKYLTE